ncbi:hypothetical protein DFH29DRAFT_871301 [Suillus ampliporus]|nr:hypothetical protein DFH29DRAFT_871301 [Suillus ampliporus]
MMQTNKVPSSNKVLFNVNLLNMILPLLFLPELHSLGQTCKILHKEELLMILHRFNTILDPFTAQFYWEFYQTLQHMKAIIVGSCALDMMLGTRNTLPRDLNIVVSHGSLSLMETFIKDVLSYHSIATGKVITITEAKRLMHPLHVVLNGPSTVDMMFITAGGAVSFYPELTRNYHTIKTMSGEGIGTGQKLGSIGKDRFDVHPNISFLNRPCHELCPSLWRHLSNHKEFITVDWDQRFSAKSILYNTDIEWHLNNYCFNPNCLYNIDVVIGNCDIPPRIMPYSPESVRQQSKYIEDHEPPYKKTFKVLLYTTACTEPLLVDIPLQDGVDQLNTLDELEVNHWVHECDVMTSDYVAPNALLQDIARNINMEGIIKAEIGSFTCGTKLQAVGSHWLGRQTESNVLLPAPWDDKHQNLSMIAGTTQSRKSTSSSRLRKNETKKIKSRVTSDNTNPDVIIVHTQRLYDIPREQCKQKKNTGKASRMHKIVLDPVASTSASQKTTMKAEDAKMSGETEHVKTNTNYGGPIFHHRRASLRQLDIRDNANNLIMPDRWYSELRQGTLILFAATMHGYVQKEPGQRSRKTWQLVAKSIKVIDCSNETVEPRYKAVLPTAEKWGTGPLVVLADFKIEKKMRSK